MFSYIILGVIILLLAYYWSCGHIFGYTFGLDALLGVDKFHACADCGYTDAQLGRQLSINPYRWPYSATADTQFINDNIAIKHMQHRSIPDHVDPE